MKQWYGSPILIGGQIQEWPNGQFGEA
ncbi:MAG: hypothetical protein QOF30_1925, partial [Acidimicrobiaceae bacterium]|nr:hypothetical protein [Acidimicrobiaceae bacterium]